MPSTDSQSRVDRFNPFPGLRPFRGDEDYLFFGREEQILELVSRLRKHRFIGVVGTSGSGKSSLVRAGVLPALLGGKMAKVGSAWDMVVMRPGSNPLKSLAEGFAQAELFSADEESCFRARAALSRSRFGLVELARQSRRDPNANLLVVVDQFEEIFRFRQRDPHSEELAEAFVKLLITASRQREVPIYVILTMRSDYLGDCSQFEDLPEAINEGEYLIPQLTREQLRAVIEGPLRVGRAAVAARLVDKLLNDVAEDPDHLPILQHALMRTWDHWETNGKSDNPIDLPDYQAIGQMSLALSQHADEVFRELNERQQAICEKLFKALTERREDNRGIRRPTRIAKISQIIGVAIEEVKEVVERFRRPGRTFLMPPVGVELTSQTVIDLSHESLMRIWGRLGEWVEEEWQSVRIYRRLAETAALHAEGKADLYRGPDLQIALSWKEQQQPNAGWAERYHEGFEAAVSFLEKSREAAETAEQEKEAARQRELDQAKALAEEQERRATEQQQAARRLRKLVGGLVTLSVLAFSTSWLAYQRSQEAESQRRRAQETTSQSDFLLADSLIEDGHVGTGLAYLCRSLENDPDNSAARLKLLSVLSRNEFPHVVQSFPVFSSNSRWHHIDIDPSGQYVVSSSRGNPLNVWDVTTEEKEAILDRNASSPSYMAHFDPTGQYLVAGTMHAGFNAIPVWDWKRQEKIVNLAHNVQHGVPTFGPDGNRLITTGNNKIKLWNWKEKEPLAEMTHEGVTDAVLVPGEQKILSVGGNGPPRLWDWQKEEEQELALKSSDLPNGSLWGCKLSPDRRWLAVGPNKDGLGIWGWRDARVITLKYPSTWVPRPPVFSKAGRRLLTPGNDNLARIWDWQDKELVSRLDHPTAVTSAAYFPDNRRVATATQGKDLRIWDVLPTRARVKPIDHGEKVVALRLLTDPDRLLCLDQAGRLRAWDPDSNKPVDPSHSLPLEKSSVPEVDQAAFSPNGARVATASIDGTIALWDVESGDPIGERFEYRHPIDSLDYSQSGCRLIAASLGKEALVFNAEAGLGVPSRLPHDERVLSASFDSNGQRSVTGTHNGKIQVWDGDEKGISLTTEQQDTAKIIQGHVVHRIQQVRFIPPGDRVLAVAMDKATVWDLQSASLEVELLASTNITALEVSKDGVFVVTGNFDGDVQIWDLSSGKVVAEPLHLSSEVTSLDLDPQMTRLVAGTDTGEIRVWSSGPGGEVPQWFLDLTEAIGGFDAAVGEAVERLPDKQVINTRQLIRKNKTDQEDPYQKWAQWLLADREERPISPHSEITVKEYVEGLLREGGTANAEEVLAVKPLDPLGLALLARECSEAADPAVDPRFLAKKATDLAPKSVIPWWSQAWVHFRLDQRDKAKEALNKALDLAPRDPNARYVHAMLLQQAGKEDEAYHAYTAAVKAITENPDETATAVLPLGSLPQFIGASGPAAVSKALRSSINDSASETRRIEWEWLSRWVAEKWPKSSIARARVLRATEQHRQALQKAQEARKLAPENLDAHLLTAHILEDLDQDAKAEEVYRKTLIKWEKNKDLSRGSSWYRLIKAYAVFLAQNGRAQKAKRVRMDHLVPSRPPEATPQQINLDQHYNLALSEKPANTTFDLLPMGLVRFNGVAFDVRGVVQLNGTAGGEKKDLPQQAEGIRIGQQCRRIHFIHGQWGDARHTKSGEYRIHYADGQTERIALQSGEDLHTSAQPWTLEVNDRSSVAWIGRTGSPKWPEQVLYMLTWDNPRPEVEIKSIDFVSEMNHPAPFLIAVTIDDGNTR